MITASSEKPLLSSLLLLGIASAQLESIEQNLAVDILSCGDLSCIDSTSGSVCQSNATLETGLGIASGVVSIPGSDRALSLTLVDGYPLGDLAYTGAWLTTQTLYAGVPANFNASGQDDACALMLQYQAQTLPEDETLARNTTSCDGTISSGLQRVLTNMIQSFDYSAYGSSNNTLPRCEALTQHFNAEIHSRQNIGPYLNTYLTATGGTLLGNHANTTVALPQYEGCQPVSPQEYTLHQVAIMDQFLYRSRPLSSADDDGGDDPTTGAGRTGITPILTVVYGDEEGGDPEVQYFCMKTFTPDGGRLPQHSLSEDGTSAASSGFHRIGVVGIAGIVVLVLLLQ
ncbi:hypothetical protein D6C84_07361 [Aureobasidium pullulans]|uniref:Uncharacterized protein n=1 Tax=Aureobasidium pullulans TaxID=5580 RepID=A0A4S9XLD0_AURPU|nr:hypothetical protein D6C84_07361 [Aureobasidium pullulans]